MGSDTGENKTGRLSCIYKQYDFNSLGMKIKSTFINTFVKLDS